MSAYRTSDKAAPRVATIRIARPRTWWTWVMFGMMLSIVGAVALFVVATEAELACSRDDMGEGSCTYRERHMLRDAETRFPVAHLRKARIESFEHKGHMEHHVIAVLDDRELELFSRADLTKQTARAGAINDFVVDVSRRELHLREDADYAPAALGFVLMCAGLLAVFAAFSTFPARRVVLDEEKRRARFDVRPWLRWNEVRTVPLDVDEIVLEINRCAPGRDGALAAARAFLDRD